jgi:hypothetical protein
MEQTRQSILEDVRDGRTSIENACYLLDQLDRLRLGSFLLSPSGDLLLSQDLEKLITAKIAIRDEQDQRNQEFKTYLAEAKRLAIAYEQWESAQTMAGLQEESQ